MELAHFILKVVAVAAIPIASCPGEAPQGTNREKKTAVRVIPILRSHVGSPMVVNTAFENTSSTDFRYIRGTDRHTPARLQFCLTQDGKIVVPRESGARQSFSRERIRTLSPGQSIIHSIDLREKYGELKPGRYEVRAIYDVKASYWFAKEFRLTALSFDRTVMLVDIIESLPKTLNKLAQLRVKQITESSHYFLGVDVGLGPVWDKKATLFVVLRESDPGKAKLNDPPKKIFRPLRVDPKARVETMLYNPFPQSTEPIIQLHVLVTEPNKAQRHVVIGELASGAAAAEIKKNETLKPGTLYKLHKDPLGSVKLVPHESR